MLYKTIITPFTFLIAPQKIFKNLKSKPQWVAPCIVVVLGLIVKAMLSNSWGNQSLIYQAQSLYLNGIMATLLVVFLWSAISIFLYLSIFLMSANNGVAYKIVFSIVSYCGVIILLGEISNYLLIRANIINSMFYLLPQRFPIGLDLLVVDTSPHPALAVFLHSINPFSIWYFTILSVGISIVTDLGKTKASTLSFILWFIAVGFAISVLLITGETSLRFKF